MFTERQTYNERKPEIVKFSFQQNARMQGSENADALVGKGGAATKRTTSATTRSALSNIGNKTNQTQDATKKVFSSDKITLGSTNKGPIEHGNWIDL